MSYCSVSKRITTYGLAKCEWNYQALIRLLALYKSNP